MSESPDPKVSFTAETITKCICPQCPVQSKSRCVDDKLKKLREIIKTAKKGILPEPGDVPGAYCSVGIAPCKDVDTAQMCICSGCQIFEKYKLAGGKPLLYYCRDGMAKSS